MIRCCRKSSASSNSCWESTHERYAGASLARRTGRRLEKPPACERHFSATLTELHDAPGVVVHAADESAYDWRGEQRSVPVHALASKVLKVGDQTLSVGAAARYWAEGPECGPHGWGLSYFVTLLFPK
jgi:hypothetical protein